MHLKLLKAKRKILQIWYCKFYKLRKSTINKSLFIDKPILIQL